MNGYIINALPTYAADYRYILATVDLDGSLWFYGAYNSEEKARAILDSAADFFLVENSTDQG